MYLYVFTYITPDEPERIPAKGLIICCAVDVLLLYHDCCAVDVLLLYHDCCIVNVNVFPSDAHLRYNNCNWERLY